MGPTTADEDDLDAWSTTTLLHRKEGYLDEKHMVDSEATAAQLSCYTGSKECYADGFEMVRHMHFTACSMWEL